MIYNSQKNRTTHPSYVITTLKSQDTKHISVLTYYTLESSGFYPTIRYSISASYHTYSSTLIIPLTGSNVNSSRRQVFNYNYQESMFSFKLIFNHPLIKSNINNKPFIPCEPYAPYVPSDTWCSLSD